MNFKQKNTHFSLAITPSHAHIAIDSKNWEKASEAILIIITQCWRFYIIERGAQSSLFNNRKKISTGPLLLPCATGSTEKRFASHDLQLRQLIQDIPHFEGLSVDPYRHCKDEQSTQLYQKLERKN